jgi:signal transduction histidine kinase
LLFVFSVPRGSAAENEGIGIPSDELPHLFERFYWAGNAATQRIK